MIVVLFICLFIQSHAVDLLNHPQMDYEILSNDHLRIKRVPSPWFYPELDKNFVSCGHNVYAKLFTCSHPTDCNTLSHCLQPLHCSTSVKSFGGLIVNLLRLLGIDNCQLDEQISSCTHEKRMIILRELFTETNKHDDQTYCNSIVNFMSKVNLIIADHCPFNARQVERFLENYFCSNMTKFFSQMAYIDEDNDLKFINMENNLLNNSQHDVYINDHLYYNVSYIIPKFESIPMYFVEDFNQFSRIDALTNRHRSALSITLKFPFPFYGHAINKILVATGGFLYTGDLLHSALIGSTQYIAPFMANFDASIGKNETEIKYYDNGTHFICTWKNIYLQDQQDAGAFTFQVILQNTGKIYFNYIQIPQVNVSTINHAHRLGLSDAYLSQHATNEHIVRVITLYDKINLDVQKIRNGLSVIFDMDQTCNTFTDCTSCLANRGARYNCTWCNDIQKCSDGYDRSRQQWIRAQCHQISSDQTCSNILEDTFDMNPIFPSSISPARSQWEERKDVHRPSTSALQTFRTILVTLLLSALILSLITLAATYVYAFRHPTTPAGMWLLEHRPSTYFARFKRFTGCS